MKNKKKNEQSGIAYLSIWMIVFYAIGMYMQRSNQFYLVDCLSFKPHDLLNGELTRFFTWIFIPSSEHGEAWWLYVTRVILVGFAGIVLERVWGRKKYNMFILRGLLLTLLCGFGVYYSAYFWADEEVACDLSSLYISTEYSTIFVLISALLMLGILLAKRNLRLYKPNLVVGVLCITAYIGMMIYEIVKAFQFSVQSAWVTVSCVLPAIANVVMSVFVYRMRRKKTSSFPEEADVINGIEGLEFLKREKIS